MVITNRFMLHGIDKWVGMQILIYRPYGYNEQYLRQE